MGNDSQLNIIVRAQNAASDVLKQVETDVKGVGSKIDAAMKSALPGSLGVAAGVAAAGAATVAFGIQSVGAYNAAAEATKKLQTNMLNTKGATMAQVQGLEALASKLQSVGVIEDDVIKAGMSQLATFNLQSSSIATLTPKITDMVAQMKGQNATAEDMVGINNLVGKVMTGNVGALSRYGVTLDENQKKQLESGNETQRAAVLTQVLAQNYGEVNKALRDTPEGRITGLKNAFGDLQEGVGEMIMTAAAPLIDWFSTFVSSMEEAGGIMEWLRQGFEKNKTVILIVAGGIMGALVPALYAAAGGFIAMMAPLLPFIAIGAGVLLIIDQVAKSMGGWGKMIEQLQLGWSAMISAFSGEGITSDGLVGFMELVGVLARQVWDFLLPSITALWTTVTTQLMPALMNLWNTLAPILLPILEKVAMVLGGSLVASIWIAINAINVIVQVVTGMVNFFTNTMIPAVVGAFNWIGEKVTWLKDHFWETIGFIIGFFATLPIKLPVYIYQAISAIVSFLMNVNWSGVFSSIGKAFEGVWNWVKDSAKKAFDYMTGINWGALLAGVAKGIGNGIVGLIEGAINGALSGLPGNMKVRIPRFAKGVQNFGGGMAIVGENGPELAYLPKGSNVYSNKESKAMMSGTTNNFNGNITLGDQGAVDRFFDRLNTDASNAMLGVAV